MNRVFTGPMTSDENPQVSRPSAEEKLKPATRADPAEGEKPSEVAYRGRKNGGTKRGKVPIAVPRKRVENWRFLNRRLFFIHSVSPLSLCHGHLGFYLHYLNEEEGEYHSIKVVFLTGALSFIK